MAIPSLSTNETFTQYPIETNIHESEAHQKKRGCLRGNHQRSWLWGHHGVCETLKAGRWPILEIFVTQDQLRPVRGIASSEDAGGIRVEVVPAARLEELAKTTDHQGIIARLGPFRIKHSKISSPVCVLAWLRNIPPRLLRRDVGCTGVLCDRLQDAFQFWSNPPLLRRR